MGALENKMSQFSIQLSSRMILILNGKYLNASQLCSYCRLAVAQSFQFSSIARILKDLICSISIHIFSLLWNDRFMYVTWSLTKMKQIFVRKFHCVPHSSKKYSNKSFDSEKTLRTKILNLNRSQNCPSLYLLSFV